MYSFFSNLFFLFPDFCGKTAAKITFAKLRAAFLYSPSLRLSFGFFPKKTSLFFFLSLLLLPVVFYFRLFDKIFRGLRHLSQLLTIQHFWSTNSNFTTSKIWLPFPVLSKILKNNLRTHVISKNL